MAKLEDADDIIRKWAKAASLDTGKAIRAATLDLYSNVVADTPVDTGRLRGNWQIALDKQPTSDIDRKYEGGSVGSENQSANSKAESELGQIKIEKDSTIYLVNNLEYAPIIEYGIGGRREFAMLRKNVKSWKQRIAQKIKEAVDK